MMKRKINCRSRFAQRRLESEAITQKGESRHQWDRSCESSDHNSEFWKRCKKTQAPHQGRKGEIKIHVKTPIKHHF